MKNRLIHLGHPEAHIPWVDVPESVARPLSRSQIVGALIIAILVAWVAYFLEHFAHGVAEPQVSWPWLAPFALLLACVALMPFIARRWWEHNYAYIAVALGAIIITYYGWKVQFGTGNLARTAAEYISFIFLLGSLYIVSGGILIRVRATASPMTNTTLLLIGALIANIFGTTGAAMLLIRPYLRMNRARIQPYHIVFFTFIVANCGGALTPIGDPPLFLGYLLGVPFFWVAEHCWKIWLFANGALLAIFYLFELRNRKRPDEGVEKSSDLGPVINIFGGVNLVFIAMIIGGIFMHAPWREIMMAAAACGSLLFTPRRVHEENHFNYAPIREIAFLFFGIFMTMLPALNYLTHTHEAIGLRTAGQYYFACGTISAMLDNAPTYLLFVKTINLSSDKLLVAISMGAVLFGAATYIGNGPNFMVKSIAEHADVPTPSFFGYIFKFTIPILLPVLVLVWWMFIR